MYSIVEEIISTIRTIIVYAIIALLANLQSASRATAESPPRTLSKTQFMFLIANVEHGVLFIDQFAPFR
jgi:hypothetical protein